MYNVNLIINALSEIKIHRDIDSLLSQKLIEVQDAERERIAIDLNEVVNQILYAAKLRIELTLQTLKEKTGLEVFDEIEESGHLLEKGIVEIRKISGNLIPDSILNLGVIPSMNNLIEAYSNGNGRKIKLNINNFNKRFDREKEISIYRIIETYLNLSGRHFKAVNISVDMKIELDYITISLENDGDITAIEEAKEEYRKNNIKVGLGEIKRRVLSQSGNIKINTADDKKLKIYITIPVK